MNYKKSVLALFIMILFSNYIYSIENMKVLKDIKIEEKAQGVNKNQVWKKIPFTLESEANVRITITASVKDNGKLDDDDLKWGLDKENFGWGTDRAWDGRDLRGEKKTVEFIKHLLPGVHNLYFWADQFPILHRILIEVEDRNIVKKIKINEPTYNQESGVKLSWENVKEASSYAIYKKEPKEEEFKELATKLINSTYFDPTVKEGKKYQYKIGILNKAAKIIFYSEVFLFEVKQRAIVETPSSLRGNYKNGKVEISWNEIKNEDLINYNIYRKTLNQKSYDRYKSVTTNRFTDVNTEEQTTYVYKISAVLRDNSESDWSKEIKIYVDIKGFKPSGIVDLNPREFKAGEMVTVYFSAKKSKEIRKARTRMIKKDSMINSEPEKIFFRYGWNGWAAELLLPNDQSPEMMFDQSLEYWYYEIQIPYYAYEFDFVFFDELGNYDKNWYKDYMYKVKKDSKEPDAPTGIVISEENQLVYLKWEANKELDAAGYEVYRSKNRTSGFGAAEALIAHIDSAVITDLRDTGVSAGTDYYYAIRAFDYSGNRSKLSTIVKASPKKTGALINRKCTWYPLIPAVGNTMKIYYSKKLGILKEKDLMIRLGVNDWDEKIKAIENYTMIYDETLNAYYYEYYIEEGIEKINISFTDGYNWDDNAGKNWEILVEADSTPPIRPVNFKAMTDYQKIRLTWDLNKEKDLAGYNIYRDGINNKINEGLIFSSEFEDVEIIEGSIYKYTIEAVDNAGNVSERAEYVIKPLRDIIYVPDVTYTLTKNDLKTRLIASIDFVSNWKLDILTDDNEVVKTYTGKGDSIIINWKLTDKNGKRLKVGKYKYRVSIADEDDVLPREVRIIILD